MKKLRLKRWVKVVLVLIIGVICVKAINNNMNDMYKQCDNAKGHTCSYYEARNYLNR